MSTSRLNRRTEDPYARAVAWVKADPRARANVSRQVASDYRRIARLPRHIGEELDRLGASYRVARMIAGGVRLGLAEVQRRYLYAAKLFAQLDGRPWTESRTRALRAYCLSALRSPPSSPGSVRSPQSVRGAPRSKRSTASSTESRHPARTIPPPSSGSRQR